MEAAPAVVLSKTKIIVPRRSGNILTRPRLLDLMADLLEKKLILLSAPAGYGKTSLLIDLADRTELPFCWLALDPLDRDPQRFLAYLIGALAEHFPAVGRQSRLLLEQLKSIDKSAESILVSLTNEIYEEVDQHFILALDDYHLVDEVPAIAAIVDRFVQLADENCHIILSSRTPPNLPELTLLVARNQVDGLSHADLAFDAGEIQALFAQNHRQHINHDLARELVEQTGGWVTGLQLSGLGLPSAAAERLRVAHASGVDLFSYLGRQVLDRQPAELRLFLLHTSLMDEFSLALCQAVLGALHSEPVDWSGLMSMIRERSLFALPLGSDGLWLRYHPLFREFLQARLREECPADIGPILRSLTKYHEDQGEWEKAYQACQQLGDTESLADLVERAGTPMSQRAMLTLDSWLKGLPPALLRARPGLISLQGNIAVNKGNAEEGIRLLTEAQEIYRKEADVAGLVLTLVRRAVTYRYRGDYQASIGDAQEVLELTEKRDDQRAIYAEALRLKGLSLYRLGDSRQALELLERAFALYKSLNLAHNTIMLQMDVGMVHRALGDYKAASAAYEASLKHWRAEGNIYWQANLLNNLGVMYHMLGQYERAILAFEEGLEDSHRSGNARFEALILASLGDLYAELSEADAALLAYQQAGGIAQQIGDGFVRNYVGLAHIRLAVQARDLPRARKLLKTSQTAMRTGQSAYERGLLKMIDGQIQLLEKKPVKAAASLKEAASIFTQDGRHVESMAGRIWLSAAACENGQAAEAREQLLSALEARRNTPHALCVALHQAQPWLATLLSDAQIRRAAGDILQQLKTFEQDLPSIRRRVRLLARSIQPPAAGLSIQALGTVQVAVAGHVLTLSDWCTQSVRDLFFYFLMARRPVTKEQVAEDLWPELDEPEKIHLRFKNEMYRLRRAAGKNLILFENETYRFNHALDYQYDVEAFRMHLAHARAAQSIAERIEHTREAVALYRGPYLADVDFAAATLEREHLSQAFLAALEELAGLYLQAGQPQSALELCQRVLAEDACREPVHQLAMRAHAVLGDRAAIARQYNICQRTLKTELGIEPSQETQKLYRQLIA